MTGLLIDDDPLIVQAVDFFVEQSKRIASCRHAGTVAEATGLLGGESFDFVLLDLHLPDQPGQDVLKAVAPEVPVIILSSDPGFGAESYQHTNIVDYLLKPVDPVSFHRAVERAALFRDELSTPPPAERAPAADAVLFLKSGSEIIRLALPELRYVKAEANYVSFHSAPQDRPVMVLATLKKIAGTLPPNFLRVHRSYLVNRNHIERVDGQAVHLDTASIPIGDSFRGSFLEQLDIIT